MAVEGIVLSSLQQTINGPVRTLDGDVRIGTAIVIIRSDSATFRSDTLDIQPSGHVHILLKKK